MVNGVERMRAMFRRKALAVAKIAQAEARLAAEQVASDMRYLAPEDEHALKRSIRVEAATSVKTAKGDRGFIGVVVKAGDASTVVTNSRGQQFQNAKLQERGTRKMKASPYFNPAWRANRRRVRSRINRAVRKAWKNG